jgi:hypothetical protein
VTLARRFRVGQVVTLDGSERVTIVKISKGGYHVHVRASGAQYSTAISESEARKRLLGDDEDPAVASLTIKQLELLERVRETGGIFLEGAEVRNAMTLEKLDLVRLEDNGSMRVDRGTRRTDGERWWCKPVPR